MTLARSLDIRVGAITPVSSAPSEVGWKILQMRFAWIE